MNALDPDAAVAAKWSYCTDNLQERLDANSRLPKDQRQTVNIDVLDLAGRAALAAKLEVYILLCQSLHPMMARAAQSVETD